MIYNNSNAYIMCASNWNFIVFNILTNEIYECHIYTY